MNKDLDYVIIGAGPAGLQTAYYLKKAGLSFKILEGGAEVGAFFRKFPRHRKMISINKVHTGVDEEEVKLRWDWNSLLSDELSPLMRDFSERYFPEADDFVAYLKTFQTRHALDVELNTRVSKITKTKAGTFVVKAANNRNWAAKRIIIATGVAESNIPAFPGADLCETYADVSVDPKQFVNKRVLILGKGNSAFETADNLVETAAVIHVASPNPLRFAWKTHFVGDLRACNNNVLDTYQLKLQNAVIDGTVVSVKRDGGGLAAEIHYSHANGEVETIRYDHVILCTGFKLDVSIFDDSCRPSLTPDNRFPVQTSSWESANVPGMFFAGTLMQQRDRKKYMSAFIHGFRYNIRTLCQILQSRYHAVPMPVAEVGGSAAELGGALLAQMNRSSALWQQPGFLADALVLDRKSQRARYFEALPVDYVKDHLLESGSVLMLTLEFGKSQADPFYFERVQREDTKNAANSTFLHPVVRCYERGRLVSEHHVLEDLAAEWKEPEHVNPLQVYLQGVLSGRSRPIAPTRRPRRPTRARAQQVSGG
ncbi:MAG TPA: NAD(P)-binding domain-containing protein [Polyangia bacterium]|jgi:thioredoxin reductase|nr:NAD(P)-binding domain-containing protein [Polyangia bacterium]